MIVAMLPHFYRSFGGDHVHNLSRVMRPPGTVNCKGARNGRQPRPCQLCKCDPTDRHPLEAFSDWIEQARRQQGIRSGSARSTTEASAKGILARNAKTANLVRQLAKPSPDRSRRDFAVVCGLLRLGLTREEIWKLVCEDSKFESNGRPYFDLTISNAERKVLVDRASVGRLGRST